MQLFKTESLTNNTGKVITLKRKEDNLNSSAYITKRKELESEKQL
jgi:hypothetical protein